MKKIINAIKDFIYNITDYSLILVVIALMVVILGWRFNILFSRGIEKNVIKELPEFVEKNEDNTTIPNGTDEEIIADNPQDEIPEPPPVQGDGLIATIEIPDGSYPSKIGDILIDSSLIDSKDEFLKRSIELGLDTRLRSGTFNIEVGTSLDNIIKLIANAK